MSQLKHRKWQEAGEVAAWASTEICRQCWRFQSSLQEERKILSGWKQHKEESDWHFPAITLAALRKMSSRQAGTCGEIRNRTLQDSRRDDAQAWSRVTQVSHIAGGFFTSWATREAQWLLGWLLTPSPTIGRYPVTQAHTLGLLRKGERCFCCVSPNPHIEWTYLHDPESKHTDLCPLHFFGCQCFLLLGSGAQVPYLGKRLKDMCPLRVQSMGLVK